MALWLVRAGSSGEQELEALKYDIATIGWNEMPDVSKIKDKEELKELYLKHNPGAEKKSTPSMVGQIWAFAKEIQKGDIIALPLKSHPSIVLGTVEGNYEFKEISPTIKHTRPVKWLKIVCRRQFDQDLLYSLGARGTVHQIERNYAEDKIRYLIENVDGGMTVKRELKTILEDYGLLKKDVSKTHLDILEKFHKKRGKYLPSNEIYGEKKYRDIRKSPLPPDEIVNAPHYMHNLITGVYTPSGDDYALSIQLNPKSRWELEIDRDFPTLRVNYDFGPNPVYKSQISKLANCYRNDIPIGIIFKTGKSKNKVLGLGKISSFDDTEFVIDSYGISEEESRLLKEETIREFDKSIADPEFSKIENINYTEFLSTIDINDEKFKGNLLIRSPEARRVKINHYITYNAYQYMKEDNFEKFIEEREKAILIAIGEKIGAGEEKSLPSMTTPHTPYTNIRIIRNAIESCRDYVYWIDKYFAASDLDILTDGIENVDLREVKILISLKSANEKMRSNFVRFREEMRNRNMICEMRAVVDPKIYGKYHDRWLLSSNVNFNLMSGEIAKRGQYAEIKQTKNRPPFNDWWQCSLDIVSNWNDVCKYRDSLSESSG